MERGKKHNGLRLTLFLFFCFYSRPFSRQLQQQQQAELEGGATRDGVYEAGPITLSQVGPRCLPLGLLAIFLETHELLRNSRKQAFISCFFYTKQSSFTM